VPAALVVVSLTSTRPARAQSSDDTQLWLTATTSGALVGPWRASAEVHARVVDDLQHYQRTVLRLQGGRALAPRLTAWFGFEESWPYAARIPGEVRLWQQLVYARPAGGWLLTHRGRLEERFIEGTDRMVPRLRYGLRATRPFRARGTWGVIAGAEVLIQLRDAALGPHEYPAGLDRDRVQAGLTRRVSRAVSIEPSYILQFINAPAPLANRREHIIQLQAVHRF